MSRSFVAMVTFHIPPKLPLRLADGWSFFSFSSTKPVHIQSLLFCCLYLFLSLSCPENGEGLDTRWQQIDPITDGDVWAEPEWFRPRSVTFFSGPSWSVAFQTIHLYPRVFPVFISLDTHLLLKSQMLFVTENINAPIWKHSAKPVSKRGSATFFFCHILSFVLIFPFAPVTCYFLLKQQFEIECSETFCVDRIHKRLTPIENNPPLLISLFWQESTSVKELNSAEVTRLCRVEYWR